MGWSCGWGRGKVGKCEWVVGWGLVRGLKWMGDGEVYGNGLEEERSDQHPTSLI